LTAAKAFASGAVPYRALLLGSGPDGDRLATALAEGLATRTGHGVDVEAVPDEPLADAAAHRLLAERDLSRLDAVVVILEPRRGESVAEVRDAVVALLADLTSRLTVGAALSVVVPAPRSSALSARELAALAAVTREAADALTPVIRLEDVPGSTEDERVTAWADTIADATAAALIDPMVGFLPDDHYDEDLRLDAVDRLPPRDGLWVAQFQRIVDEARAAYGTSCAALTIIDADHTRYGVTRGLGNDKVLRRGQSICNRVLRTYGGLIVPDAQLDHRFERNPEVRAGDVRFYAGYRIESEDGAPLGSLCVFDPTPRHEVSEQDLVALRDLAIEAQRRIWALQRAAA
jgi:GAF domain-containing protein